MSATVHPTGYATPDALWSAVNARIRQRVKTNPTMTVSNLQRQFVYDRFLARVFSAGDGTWVLKGGTALLARVRSARHSQDVDLFRRTGTIDGALAEFQDAAAVDLGDHFRFVTGAVELRQARAGRPGAMLATVKVDGYAGVRKVAAFTVDLVIGSIITTDPEPLRPDLTVRIDDLSTPDYLLYPVVDHIADKVCATFELYGAAQLPSTRIRDFVDLVVIARTQTVRAAALRIAIEAERHHRDLAAIVAWGTPKEWSSLYARAAREVAECVEHRNYAAASGLVARFLDPVLSGAVAESTWEPNGLYWTPDVS